MDINELPEVKEGQRLGAAWLNTLLAAVRACHNLSVDAPLQLAEGPAGRSLFLAASVAEPGFWARVDSREWDDDAEDWRYTATEVDREATASTWTAVTDGRTAGGDPAEGDPNTEVLNGIWLRNSYTRFPLAVGQVVWVHQTKRQDEYTDGEVDLFHAEWWTDTPAVPRTLYVRKSDDTQDGSNKRWEYEGVEVEKTTDGYDGWTDKVDGQTVAFFNRIEEMNGASGLFGNGVNSANLTGSFTIKPIPDGCILKLEEVINSDGDTEWWCEYVNQIDGTCS